MNLTDAYRAYVQTHGKVRVGCWEHDDCRENEELALACRRARAPKHAEGAWKVIGIRRAAWPTSWLVLPCLVPAWSIAGPLAPPRQDDLLQGWADIRPDSDGVPDVLGTMLPYQHVQTSHYTPVIQDSVALDWELLVYPVPKEKPENITRTTEYGQVVPGEGRWVETDEETGLSIRARRWVRADAVETTEASAPLAFDTTTLADTSVRPYPIEGHWRYDREEGHWVEVEEGVANASSQPPSLRG